MGLLLLIIVLWGANWSVMKVGLTYIPPLTSAATVVLGEPVTPANILGFLLIGGGLVSVCMADVGK